MISVRPDTASRSTFAGASQKFRKAFSLVEMVLVMGLIAIMTTVALYSYASFRNNIGLDTSISIINQYLIQAKNRSINEGQIHVLMIDLTNENIWINRLDALGNVEAFRVVENERLPDDAEIDIVKVNGIPHSGGVLEVQFQPSGSNPLLIFNISKAGIDNSPENIAAIRLYPVSSQSQVLRGQHL